MEILGILLSLGLLMFLAYRGFSVILFAPVFAILAALFNGIPGMPLYTDVFMVRAANYFKDFFPFFLLGAVFGKVMEESGAAHSIARSFVRYLGPKQSFLPVVLACAVLTYGGVSLFVVAFAVYPFAAALFKEADIPKRLVPGAIALGSFTFTMDAFPGTPQIQNVIPTKFFGTTLYAAPVTGIIGGLIVLGLGLAWLEYRKRKAMAAGEGYGSNHTNEPTAIDDSTLPNPLLAVIPLVSVLVLYKVMLTYIIPAFGPGWQGAMTMAKINWSTSASSWSLVISLVIGIILASLVNPKAIKGKLVKALNAGAIGSLLAILNTASEVGYGGVIASLPGFKVIAAALLSIKAGGTPLVSEAVTVNVLAGITGSASGGMSVALEMMGKQYLEWANSVGLSPELLHRVASMSAGGCDTMPHNGAVITLLGICGLTHRQSYLDIFAITIIKTLTVFVMILLTSIFHFV